MARKLKILLSAYACEPGKGSEPGVGWHWATSLAQLHDVTVITRANNESAITSALNRTQQPHPKFEYYDLPKFFVWCKRAGMPVHLYYLLWQMCVRWKFRRQLPKFQIIHHVTFNSFRQPGFWWRCGTPVVLGPLGGGQICPWRFFPLMRGRRIAEFLRSLSVMASRILPHVRVSFAAATRILVANRDTEKRIPPALRPKVERLLETGIHMEALQPAAHRREREHDINLLWLSWLIPIKAPELVIRAFAVAKVKNPGLRLTMAGDGPLRAGLETLARKLGVDSSISWRGRIPLPEVADLFNQHDVFVFTSLRDTSGNVLLEAMAAGLPAITLLHQGAADIATDQTAIRIPPVSISQVVQDIAEAMLRLADSPVAREKMGRAAADRIRDQFLWARKAEKMTAVYESALREAALT